MEEKVSISSKFWLCSADFCTTVMNTLITGGGLTYFFVTYMGLSSALASTVWLIFGIWNAFNDPLFGFISDHTKSKLGRRVPYIRYGAFIFALIFIVSWWTFSASQTALFIQMLLALFLFDTLYTAIATSIYVMPYELAISDKARSKIFLWKLVFMLFAIIVPMVLLPMVKPQPGESPAVFRWVMTGIGVFSGIVIFVSTFFYKERGDSEPEKQPPLFKAIANCFKNKSFIVFEIISFSVTFIQTILMLGIIYYFDAFKNCPMAACYAALVVGALVGMALWITQLTKLGVKKLTAILCLVFGLGTILMTFLGGNLIASLVGFFAAGFGFSGGMYLIPIINGDVIDYDESISGLRREGMYAGVNSLLCKPAISLANALFPAVLGWFGYNKAVAIANQSAWAKQGILVAWMAAPAILLIICYIAIHFYPLDGKEWDETKKMLEEKHRK